MSNNVNIAICHGQNCRDVGGKEISDTLSSLGIRFEVIPCQSLCSYAPTAQKNGKAILRANIKALTQPTDA